LRFFEFGVKQSLPLDVNPECLVGELKTKINSYIQIPASHQELYIFMYGKFEQMGDECSLSFYQISEGQRLMLKSPHHVEKMAMG